MAIAKTPAAAKASAKKPATPAKVTAKPKAAPKAAPAKTRLVKAKPHTGETTGKVSATAKEEFANFKEQASSKAREAADRGKERTTEALGGIGKILRDSAATIDEKVGAQYGDYARKAADAVDGFANKVDEKDVDDMLEDARQFVRKSPAVAIGAAAAVGFVLARLIRSGRDS
jgi:ElaB/YqjD/DUF883 family membrane-anchored ribosome-binding protein